MTEYKRMDKHGNVIEIHTKPQSELTADCWSVQFRGLVACKECQSYCKPNCGGGKTLLNILAQAIIDRKKGLGTELPMIDQSNIGEGLEKGLPFYKILNGEFSFRLKEVYQKYVQLAAEQHQETQNENERLDNSYFYPDTIGNPDYWKLIERSGYHQCQACNCQKTTEKGAYRDEIYKHEVGTTIYYYHQHCIMYLDPDEKKIQIDNCGWKTKTTKERLNKYLENEELGFEFEVFQKDGEWFILNHKLMSQIPMDFVNGMTLKY